MKGSDLLGGKETYLFDRNAPNFKAEIKSDTEFNTALLIGHDDDGNIWIIPASEINNLPITIHEGFIDNKGNEYHNIYVSNEEGQKLIGTVFFEKGKFMTRNIDSLYTVYESALRTSKQLLDKLGNPTKIPIFSSTFFVAYGYATGNNYVTGIQETIVNIEHIEAHKPPLPDVTISYDGTKIQEDPQVNVKTNLEPEAEIKLAFLSNFLHQLYGQFNSKNPELNILHVFESFLRLHDKGRTLHNGEEVLYSSKYYKLLFDALSPSIDQLKEIVQYYVEIGSDNKESIEHVVLKQKNFYRTFQTLLKNMQDHDLIKGTLSSVVLISDISAGDVITTNDYPIIDGLNKAFQDLFGDVGILLLKTGLMSFKVKNDKIVDMDFRKHTSSDLGTFLKRIGIRTLYSYKLASAMGDLRGSRSISGYSKRLEVFSSFLLSGYREVFSVDNKPIHRYNTPQMAFGNELFETYLDGHYSRSYQEEVMTKFLDNHFSKYVTLTGTIISRGISKNILSGRQILFMELVEMIQETLDLKNMPSIGTGTDQMKRKVALYHLMPQFLHEFYLIPASSKTTDWQPIQFFGEMRKMIYSGVSWDLIYGNTKIVNPLFHIDKSNPATGFHIPIDLSKFSETELQAIIWTLDYHENYKTIKPEFENEHKRVNNIWNQIKDPVKETYDRLYDILWNSPMDKFTLRFYQAHSTGIDLNKPLGNVVPSGSRGLGIKDGNRIEITLDRSDPDSIIEFNEKILSAIHYLAKYPYSYTVVKTRNSENLLYASLTEILDEEFVKTSFSSNPKVVGGSLSSYAVSNYEKWKNGFFDGESVYHPGWNHDSEHWASGRQLWTLRKIYPLYLFSDANSDHFGTNDLAERLVGFFATLTGEKYRGIDEILRLI